MEQQNVCGQLSDKAQGRLAGAMRTGADGGLKERLDAFRTAPLFASYGNAHSLGNRVACSAIWNHGMHVSKYFMLNAFEQFLDEGGLR